MITANDMKKIQEFGKRVLNKKIGYSFSKECGVNITHIKEKTPLQELLELIEERSLDWKEGLETFSYKEIKETLEHYRNTCNCGNTLKESDDDVCSECR